jgi:hypothetical protein
LAIVVKQYVRSLERIWTRTLNDLFMDAQWESRLLDWMQRQPVPSTQQDTHSRDVPSEDVEMPEDIEAAPSQTQNDPTSVSVADLALASIALAVGALHGVSAVSDRRLSGRLTVREPERR